MSSADHTLAVDHRLKEAEVRNVKKRRIEAEARTLGNTQFEGVVWNRREKKWRAQKNVDLKAEALGDFDTAEEAARQYDVYAVTAGLPLNFPAPGQVQAYRTTKSKYVGVNWSTGNQKWKAQIKVDGKQTHLGYFDVQEAAARKYDAAASQAGKPVNFPSLLDGASQQEQHPTPTTTTTRALQVQVVLASVANVANKRGTSKYKGVAWSKKSLKWQVEIRLDGKSKYLGLFETEEEAAYIYDEAAAPLGKPLNFPPSAPLPDSLQSLVQPESIPLPPPALPHSSSFASSSSSSSSSLISPPGPASLIQSPHLAAASGASTRVHES